MKLGYRKEPPPGSDEARARGCICPVFDNHHGEGIPLGIVGEGRKTRPQFWVSARCPVHTQKAGWR